MADGLWVESKGFEECGVEVHLRDGCRDDATRLDPRPLNEAWDLRACRVDACFATLDPDAMIAREDHDRAARLPRGFEFLHHRS